LEWGRTPSISRSNPNLSSLGSLKDSIEEALAAREEANALKSKSSAAIRHAVREIRDSGYTSRDTGILLRMSNQRVSQLRADG